MLFYTVGQSIAFLLMLKSGLFIGLWYDLTRLLRRLFQPGFIMSLALDLLFGAGTAALLILSLMRALDGELRLYAMMGALCGFLLYGVTLSPLLRAVFRGLSGLAGRVCRALGGCAAVKKILK